jgi:hypothetical protein
MASMPHASQGVEGKIFAACYNPERSGPYSHEHYETVLSSLDLVTGEVTQVPLKLDRAHDALKIKDEYIVIPNGLSSQTLRMTDLSGKGQDIELPHNLAANGHGYYDDFNNVIIIPTTHSRTMRGFFVVIDPKDYKVIDTLSAGSYAPHDMQLYDDETFVVCNYNVNSYGEDGFMRPMDGYSDVSLYDRKTLKLKEKIPAYKDALVTHGIVTEHGDFYAIGMQEYSTGDISNWDTGYIEDKFNSFFKESHPELESQWSDIVRSTGVHRVEKSQNTYGLPILPIKMSVNSDQMEILPIDDFHHRRAQSICYVEQTKTVCMSFPNTNSILLYKAQTDEARSLTGQDLQLTEMRGICEIEGTPYLAIAGIRRGMSIVDTRNLQVVNNYDVIMGRIIHMNYVI